MPATTSLADHIATARAQAFAFFMDAADNQIATSGPVEHSFAMQISLLGAVNSLARHHGTEVAAQWLNAAASDIGVQIGGPPQRWSAFLRGFICGAVVTAVVGVILIGGFVIYNGS